VTSILLKKDKELRRLSKHLYEQDYLDAEEMGNIIEGKGLGEKEENKVRTWDEGKDGKPTISFDDERKKSKKGPKTPPPAPKEVKPEPWPEKEDKPAGLIPQLPEASMPSLSESE